MPCPPPAERRLYLARYVAERSTGKIFVPTIRDAVPGSSCAPSLQVRVLRFGLLEDGDVGVGILP